MKRGLDQKFLGGNIYYTHTQMGPPPPSIQTRPHARYYPRAHPFLLLLGRSVAIGSK